MRIIKSARKVREARIECLNCHSILGIEEDDIYYRNMDYQVTCPVCDTTIMGLNKTVLFPWVMQEENEDDREVQGNNTMRIN